jgi:AAA family ATP:ADP antiporter
MTDTEHVHDSEERVRWVATITLGLLLAAHTVLETGRDALFLANIPVERLPWIYIAVSLFALLFVRIAGRTSSVHALQRRLCVLQLVAAVSMFGFWQAIRDPGPWHYYALYGWSGIISSVMVVTFWMLLGDIYTITQGKRLFASIAIGGSLGALSGAALATLIAPVVEPVTLLLVAGCLFAMSAIGPMSLSIEREEQAVPRDGLPTFDAGGMLAGVRQAITHPYARRVALLVALASATLTLADYLFKSVLADQVPAEDLSVWLARIYLGLNFLSILMLAAGVTPFVRRLGVDRSLALLPVLIALSTAGVLVGATLSAIILLKAADGTLRYSLHKTAVELLYLPMDSRLRASVKGVIDLVGGSGAKALASVAILLLVQAPAPDLAIASCLLALAVFWAISALELRASYLDVFRRTLKRGAIEIRMDYPELDIASLETLIRALSDSDERAVIAAMELLEERDRSSLIPSLILYHPSPEVVAKAIGIFAGTGQDQVLDFADRLLQHEYASVRSAIVRATAVLSPDRDHLQTLSRSDCPCIRVSAVAGLLAHGWVDPAEADEVFQAAILHREPETRIAVANAAKLSYAKIYQKSLPALARDVDLNVAREAVFAIQNSQDSDLTPILVSLLDDRRIRDVVREALLERNEDALNVLARSLEDSTTSISVQRHIPRTISKFATPEATAILLDALDSVRSGMVRYKVLRGLEPLLVETESRLESRGRILEEMRTTASRGVFLQQSEAELVRGQKEDPTRETTGGKLLIDLIRDKRELVNGRLFLLLALLFPSEDFREIEVGLRSESATRRASGVELLEHLLPSGIRSQIIGLVSRDAATVLQPLANTESTNSLSNYEASLRALANDPSEAVQAFSMYHEGELSFDESSSLGRALGIIANLPETLASPRSPALGTAGS